MAPDRWLAVQPGLETAAPRMVKRHLAYKTKPFSSEEWADIVKEGVSILNEHYFYPALTLIVSFPDEQQDETRMTTQLVRELRDTKSIIAPLLYQDYDEKDSMTFDKMNEAQFELFWECWRHNLRQFSSNFIVMNAVRTRAFTPIMKAITAVLIKVGTQAVFRYLKGISKRNFGKSPEDVVGRII